MDRAAAVDAILLDALYSAILGETPWRSWLEHLASVLPGGKAVLFFHSIDRAEGAFVLSSGFDPSSLKAYNEHYAALNPWMPKAAVRPIGVGVRAEQMLSRQALVKTEFYCDFLRPQRLQTGAGVTVVRNAGTSFLLSVLSEDSDEDQMNKATETLTRLAPHIRRAFGYFKRHAAEEAVTGLARSILDLTSIGVLLVDSEMRLIAKNVIAERALSEGRGIGLGVMGRLKITSDEATQAMRKMLGRQWVSPSARETASFRIASGDGTPTLRLTLIPYNYMSEAAEYFSGPMVLVLIDDLITPLKIAVDEVRGILGLTRAEAELVVGLVGGSTLRDLAATRDISLGTARSQLHSIFGKLGVSGQGEAVRLVLRLTWRLSKFASL